MISISDRARLKGATRLLLQSAGGIDAVAAALSVGRSQISRYQVEESAEFISINKVVALESLEGVPPHISRALAALSGHILVERPIVEGAGAWGKAVGELVKEVGDVIQALGVALGDDGKVTAAECKTLEIVQQVDEALSKLVAVRNMLGGLK